jgi:hypothetical protein
MKESSVLVTSINQKMHVGGIFCDLAKAFGCVNHVILLAKLHFYGIRGVTADWFKFYLTNRRQKVEIKPHIATQNVFCDWGTLIHWSFPRINSRAFIIYVNNLPRKINSISKPILFADDTSVIIYNRNLGDFCTVANLVLSCMIEWFTANNLVLNLDKTNIMKFITNNLPHCALHIDYRGKYIEETINTKFRGLQVDNHFTWKNHINQMVPKLSGAYYIVRSMYHISNINTVKSIYFAYFHSIIKYGIIF